MNTLELKAQAYDLLAQIEFHQVKINELRKQFEEVNNQIQETYLTSENEKSELSSDESSDQHTSNRGRSSKT